MKRPPARIGRAQGTRGRRAQKFYLTYPKQLVPRAAHLPAQPRSSTWSSTSAAPASTRRSASSRSSSTATAEVDRGGRRVAPRAGRHGRADREERHRMTLGDAADRALGRQIILPEVGGRGQERLLAATAAVAATATPRASPRTCSRAPGSGAAATARRRHRSTSPAIRATAPRAGAWRATRGGRSSRARRADAADVTRSSAGRASTARRLAAPGARPRRRSRWRSARSPPARRCACSSRRRAAGRVQTLDLADRRPRVARALDGPGCAACGATAS